MKYNRPNRIHEANIQAELYCQFKRLNIKCVLEHKIYCAPMNCNIIPDIVIVEDGEIVCIVEVKSKLSKFEPNKSGKQYKKYEAIGIPFFYCMHMRQVMETVKKVLELMSHP